MAVATVLAALDWAAVAAGSRLLERCAKPAVLLALLAAALVAQPRHSGVHGWLLLALCFGLIGDVALSFAPPGQSPNRQPPDQQLPAQQLPAQAEPGAPPSPAERPTAGGPTAGGPTAGGPTAGLSRAGLSMAEAVRSDTGELVAAAQPVGVAAAKPIGGAHRARPSTADGDPDGQPSALFTAGLASFLLGHLCYCAAMLAHGTDQLSLGFGLVLVLIALFAFGHRILAGAHAQGGTGLTIAVAAYIAALGSTVVLGVGTSSLGVAAGIVLFAFSDLVLATDRFVVRRSWADLTVAVSYHLAQALLLLGLVS